MYHFVKGHFYLKNYFYRILISDWAKASALIIYKLWLSKIDLATVKWWGWIELLPRFSAEISGGSLPLQPPAGHHFEQALFPRDTKS